MERVDLVAVVVLGFAGSGSPGPNNALLLASGLNYGFKSTLPHIVGAAGGIAVLVLIALVGVGNVTEVEAADLALRSAASIYLLYLAGRVALSGALHTAHGARPLNARQAALFQFVNPKAWLFATTVVAAALAGRRPTLFEGLVIVVTAIAVATCSFLAWAAGSSIIKRVITSERSRRILNLVIAATLVGSIWFLWI